MKYKFNGLEIDSKIGDYVSGIPSGDSIPVRAGDTLEWGVNKITMRSDGLFNFTSSTLVRARGEVPPPVQFRKEVDMAVELAEKFRNTKGNV